MTRFARAKGSKSSNERLPEEATSWADMQQQLKQKKQQIEDNQHQKQADVKRKENYDKFLKEKETEELQNSAWADIPETITTQNKKVTKKQNSNANKTKKSQNNLNINNNNDDAVQKVQNLVKKTKCENSRTEENGEKSEETGTKEKIGKKRKMHGENEGVNDAKQEKTKKKQKKGDVATPGGKRTKGGKPEVTTPVKKTLEEMTEEEQKKVLKSKEKKLRQLQNRKLKKAKLKEQKLQNEASVEGTDEASTPLGGKTAPNLNTPPAYVPYKKPVKPLQVAKPRTLDPNVEHKRRKPKDETQKVMINGKSMELVYFEGFPIKKEDADRLFELRKQMISKGLPRSEVRMAMKLERRRAEKALTRDKKNVCYNCRQGGHVLAECPSLNNENNVIETAGSGICFKCGSTEHTSFVCKVVKSQEFKFASCFICKEQGHISWQCPDNARGLYPKGGSCKMCGDVTHLKKDCPKYVTEQESNNMTLDTMMDASNPDCMGDEVKNTIGVGVAKVNKIVKF